jgi:hypothetical protein
LEATFVPLSGRWLLILAAVRRALAHRRLTFAHLPPGRGARVAGHQLGQQCCPMPTIANPERQHKSNSPCCGAKGTVPLRSGPVSATLRKFKWTMGCAWAQWLA